MYGANNGNLESRYLAWSWVNKKAMHESYLSHRGRAVLCNKPFSTRQQGRGFLNLSASQGHRSQVKSGATCIHFCYLWLLPHCKAELSRFTETEWLTKLK